MIEFKSIIRAAPYTSLVRKESFSPSRNPLSLILSLSFWVFVRHFTLLLIYEFPEEDSDLNFLVQSQASCQLDEREGCKACRRTPCWVNEQAGRPLLVVDLRRIERRSGVSRHAGLHTVETNLGPCVGTA